MKLLKFIFILSCLASLVACTKQDDDSMYGNADIQSQIYSIAPNSWSTFGTPGVAGYAVQVTIAVPIITAYIVNSGAVMAYISTDNQTWESIAETYPITTYTEPYNFWYSTNKFTLDIEDNDYLTAIPQHTIYLKIVTMAAH